MISRLLDRRSPPNCEDQVVHQLDLFSRLVADLGCPHWVFDLVLVEDEAMARLNYQFRGKQEVTDVLSFSYLLEGGPSACDLSRGQGGAFLDLWVDPLAVTGHDGESPQIGEVILAPCFITTRCRQRRWTVEDEFPLLVVHGGLHLLGWDHQNDGQTKAMRDLEQKYLATCGLPHPLRQEERLNG